MEIKILLTGGSGFLGKLILKEHKNSIKIGRDASNDIKCDLSNNIPVFNAKKINLIIHCAGKAHVYPKTIYDNQEFFNVNVRGTQNLLRGLEQSVLPKTFVFISSVAVYGLDKGINIKESQALSAKDPYGLSKIQAEEIIQRWCKKNGVICTILRLPLLVGPQPPGNLGAMIHAIKKGYYMNIGGGDAHKSMVMAEDVAKFILAASKIGGIYNLTDGYHPNFKELSSYLSIQLNKHNPLNIPSWVATLIAKLGDLLGNKAPLNSYKLSKIKSELTFDDSKARLAFGWNPSKVIESFKINT